MVDRIDTMQAFMAVVAAGSFTQAAERLQLSPQLVSKYVRELEQRLGVRLLDRTTRRLRLTEAGSHYLQQIQPLLEQLDAVEHQLTDLQTQPRGRLRITAPVTFGTRHLAPLIVAFQQAYPAVSIDLQLDDRKLDIVAAGFDLALRIGHLPDSSLVARQLAPIQLRICAAPAYLRQFGTPATLAELRQHQHLHYTYAAHNSFGEVDAGQAQSSHLASNNGDMLLQAAIAGAGVVIQPTFIAGPALAAGQLSAILRAHEPAPLGLYAVYPHRELLPSKIRSFIDYCAEYFGDPPYWDRDDPR